MNRFSPLEGIVTSISPMQTTVNDRSACTLLFVIQSRTRETFQVVVNANTFVLNQDPIQRGDIITAFYDSMAPMPLIYPPQYRAVAVLKSRANQFATLDYFDRNLVNSDNSLKLNPSEKTVVQLENGQPFLGTLGNQMLLVLYSTTTRSLPPQTTPSKIVVFCTVT